jgi:predicted TIM-barrel fold metal-dependent hydrolase
MTYGGERIILDADSHIMEPATFMDDLLEATEVERFHRGFSFLKPRLDAGEARAKERHASSTAAAEAERRLLLDKGWSAIGANDPAERTRVLDLLGFKGQLIFPTYAGMFLLPLDAIFPENAAVTRNPDLLYVWCRALNRAMIRFCSRDRRLLPVGVVSLSDPARAAEVAEEAILGGCAALWIPSVPAGKLAPTHPDVDVFWSVLERTNTPFVLHVGGSGSFPDRAFNNNNLPIAEGSGDGEKLSSKGFMAIYQSPAFFLSALILDGLFDRFPKLRGACIEQGAAWVVSWLHQLEHAFLKFRKQEPHLAKLQGTPAEYVRRHLKFTPYPGEKVGWIMDQIGSELLLFSSDYPHPEGGTDPIRDFEATLSGVSAEDKQRFFAGNMADLLGRELVST